MVKIGDRIKPTMAFSIGRDVALDGRQEGLVYAVEPSGHVHVVFEGKGTLKLTPYEFSIVKKMVKATKVRLGDKVHFPLSNVRAKTIELHLGDSTIKIVGEKKGVYYEMTVEKKDLVEISR